MKAILFAAGNQTRFGKTVEEQSKVLFPLPDGSTVLQNTLDQLDVLGLESIIIAVGDKKTIRDYVQTKTSRYSTPITIDEFDDVEMGMYMFRYQNDIPATFIFGDSFFPANSLSSYFKSITNSKAAWLGVSEEHVGDYRVAVGNGTVQEISKALNSGYYTSGIFTILDKNIIKDLERAEKFSDVFGQIPKRGATVGFTVLPSGIIDLDTFDETAKLPHY
jgi:choline kinase